MRGRTEKELKAEALEKGIMITFDDGSTFNSELKKDVTLARLMRGDKKPPPAKKTTEAKPGETPTAELVTMIQQNNKEMLATFIEVLKQVSSGAEQQQVLEWHITFKRNDDYLLTDMFLKAVE